MKRALIASLAFASLALSGCWSDNSTAAGNEKLADAVTRAVLAGDMGPVKNDFVEERWPVLADKSKVRIVTEKLIPLGALISVHEDTPANAAAGQHHFTAHFTKQDISETMELDSSGKIVHWRAYPPGN